MTDGTRFKAALCISFFLHFMLLQTHWNAAPTRAGKGERLGGELTSSAPLFSETVSIAVESFAETAPPGDGADTLQKERREYLGAVSDAIHARRFVSAAADRTLIGLAWFSFTITADGGFTDIALAESSGNPALDRAGEAAVREAGGTIKRPASLGREEIALVIAVKYQYDL